MPQPAHFEPFAVSTRSRPKAAGIWIAQSKAIRHGFNTQPPEGGWPAFTADETLAAVSTRSRPKAAGRGQGRTETFLIVSTRSRPKAAGNLIASTRSVGTMFQHAAARRRLAPPQFGTKVNTWFQHAAARRRLESGFNPYAIGVVFQHAAARRRLEYFERNHNILGFVSTRSRPKAAGKNKVISANRYVVSTRSRPKAAGETIHNHALLPL